MRMRADDQNGAQSRQFSSGSRVTSGAGKAPRDHFLNVVLLLLQSGFQYLFRIDCNSLAGIECLVQLGRLSHQTDPRLEAWNWKDG